MRGNGKHFLALGSAADAVADFVNVGMVCLADDDGVDAEVLP